MTGLLLASGLLVAAALALLLWPLLKGRAGQAAEPSAGAHSEAPQPEAPHLAVLREQAAQLEAERRAGLLDASQHAQAQAELARRVLEEEAEEAEEAQVPASRHARPQTSQTGQGRRTAWALTLALPLMVAGIYARLGQPEALQAAAPAAPSIESQVEAMVRQMAARLENGPPEQAQDPTAWAMLARSLAALQRFPEADSAYLRAIALAPRNAQLLADRADLLALARGPQGRAEVDRLIAQALDLDPRQPKALALAGSAAMERQDWPAAVAYLERAGRVAPAGSEFAADIQSSLAAARAAGGLPAASAANMAPVAPVAPVVERSALRATAGSSTLSGTVELAPAFTSRPSPGSTLFIYARAVNGPRMPLAVLRLPVGAWPVSFKLDDTLAMAAELRLSQYDEVVVQARISQSGQALPQSGDWHGQSGPARPGSSGLKVVIDRMQP